MVYAYMSIMCTLLFSLNHSRLISGIQLHNAYVLAEFHNAYVSNVYFMYHQEYIRRESIELCYVPRKHRWESNVTYT